ncbi:MAG: glyoxylate/hydroxypyruvate reductase A [Candidatus Endobugula sp.]|jgi:glyoxylate/hydroxypyruvate reductase A
MKQRIGVDMNIVFYGYQETSFTWIDTLRRLLPSAVIEYYSEEGILKADYLICRNPPQNILAKAHHLKAVFFLSAGIDYFLRLKAEGPCEVLEQVDCYRLEDAGMSEQMMDYASYAVLKFFRQFDRYDQQNTWQSHPPYSKARFSVGILGAGVLGMAVAQRLFALGFSVNMWSRSKKEVDDISSYAGKEELPMFLDHTHILINLLPLNKHTHNIINADVFQRLAKPSYFVNLARGAHVVEADLVQALDANVLNAAQIDVAEMEPLPEDSPLYSLSNLFITPHNSAVTLLDESCQHIAEKIQSLSQGEMISGKVDWHAGY